MRRYPKLLKWLVVAVLLIPVWSFLIWLIKPVKPIDIFIMDKTVLFSKGDEHRSFNWLLAHHKYSKPNKKLYNIENDYWGFFPIERGESFFVTDLDSLSYYQIDSIAYQKDMTYFTDMYGMYVFEWYRDTILWKERSAEIYGGLTEKELHFLQMMKAQQKLLITEFNFYHHPTPGYIRHEAEKLINTEWTEWIGRYFDPLIYPDNEELPAWVYDNYRAQHGGKWPFTKAGIVFVRSDDTIEILEIDTHLNVEIPYIYTGRYGRKTYGLPRKIHYPFWFDISLPANDSNLIVSSFQIEPNLKGDSILRRFNVPTRFPALMESTGPSPYYYFGADFCDNPIKDRSAYFAGSGWLDFMFYDNDLLRREKFFYEYYRPLMRKIMRTYYKDLKRD